MASTRSGDYDLRTLSGSVAGESILVAATASPGTLLHTAINGTVDYWDMITLEVVNLDSVDHTITIQWGGTAAKDAVKKLVKAGGGVVVVVDRRRLCNSLEVRAYADATNVLAVYGDVDRYQR